MSGRGKTALVGGLVLALVAFAGPGASSAAKKGKSRTFEKSVAVNAPIPDRVMGNTYGTPLTSELTVPKKFKGKVVGDLNVTGIQTTGVGGNAVGQLTANIIAPSGRSLVLWSGGLGGTSMGPLTLDDDTRTSVCDDAVDSCTDPDATLLRPFAGTANLAYLFNGLGPLSTFNGQRMRGTWTFRIIDTAVGQTSTLNGWGLKIKAAKPVPE